MMSPEELGQGLRLVEPTATAQAQTFKAARASRGAENVDRQGRPRRADVLAPRPSRQDKNRLSWQPGGAIEENSPNQPADPPANTNDTHPSFGSYIAIHQADGKFLWSFPCGKSNSVLGYPSHKLVTLSPYTIMHQGDIASVGHIHRKITECPNPAIIYRYIKHAQGAYVRQVSISIPCITQGTHMSHLVTFNVHKEAEESVMFPEPVGQNSWTLDAEPYRVKNVEDVVGVCQRFSTTDFADPDALYKAIDGGSPDCLITIYRNLLSEIKKLTPPSCTDARPASGGQTQYLPGMWQGGIQTTNTSAQWGPQVTTPAVVPIIPPAPLMSPYGFPFLGYSGGGTAAYFPQITPYLGFLHPNFLPFASAYTQGYLMAQGMANQYSNQSNTPVQATTHTQEAMNSQPVLPNTDSAANQNRAYENSGYRNGVQHQPSNRPAPEPLAASNHDRSDQSNTAQHQYDDSHSWPQFPNSDSNNRIQTGNIGPENSRGNGMHSYLESSQPQNPPSRVSVQSNAPEIDTQYRPSPPSVGTTGGSYHENLSQNYHVGSGENQPHLIDQYLSLMGVIPNATNSPLNPAILPNYGSSVSLQSHHHGSVETNPPSLSNYGSSVSLQSSHFTNNTGSNPPSLPNYGSSTSIQPPQQPEVGTDPPSLNSYRPSASIPSLYSEIFPVDDFLGEDMQYSHGDFDIQGGPPSPMQQSCQLTPLPDFLQHQSNHDHGTERSTEISVETPQPRPQYEVLHVPKDNANSKRQISDENPSLPPRNNSDISPLHVHFGNDKPSENPPHPTIANDEESPQDENTQPDQPENCTKETPVIESPPSRMAKTPDIAPEFPKNTAIHTESLVSDYAFVADETPFCRRSLNRSSDEIAGIEGDEVGAPFARRVSYMSECDGASVGRGGVHDNGRQIFLDNLGSLLDEIGDLGDMDIAQPHTDKGGALREKHLEVLNNSSAPVAIPQLPELPAINPPNPSPSPVNYAHSYASSVAESETGSEFSTRSRNRYRERSIFLEQLGGFLNFGSVEEEKDMEVGENASNSIGVGGGGSTKAIMPSSQLALPAPTMETGKGNPPMDTDTPSFYEPPEDDDRERERGIFLSQLGDWLDSPVDNSISDDKPANGEGEEGGKGKEEEEEEGGKKVEEDDSAFWWRRRKPRERLEGYGYDYN